MPKSSQTSLPRPEHINWIPALTLKAISLAVLLLICVKAFLSGFSRGRGVEPSEIDSDTGLYIMLLWFATLALAVTFSATLHYRCWAFLPAHLRSVTPGKAVGFMFIPFYNLYWAFVSWPQLAKGFEDLQRAFNLPNIRKTYGLALTYAILFASGIVAYPIPILGLAVWIAEFVIFVLLYGRIVGIANSLADLPGNKPLQVFEGATAIHQPRSY